MDFELTEEQEMLRHTVRDIAQKIVAPRAAELDRTGEYPRDIKEVLVKQNLFGLTVPEEYDGFGANLLTTCLVIKELAKVDCSVAGIMVGVVDGIYAMLLAANEEQKQRYLPKLALGATTGAIAITEPGAGSDVAAMAKLLASDTAMRVTTDAVQVLGGYGYMKDHPVERMMRDAKLTQLYVGTNQIQRVIIGRALLA